MSCKLILGSSGEVVGVKAPNDNSSVLFQSLLEKTKDIKKATELTLLTSTEKFKETVVKPILFKYRNFIKNSINKLPAANTTVKLLVDNKEYNVDLSKLQYPVVHTKGITTIQAITEIAGKKEQLGRIRLKSYKDGFAIDSSLLGVQKVNSEGKTEDLKGRGIGTELYKSAISYALKQNKPLYSDSSQTQDAKGIWNKLQSTNVITQEDGRYKVEAFPPKFFDKNQEVKPELVLTYLSNSKVVERMLSFEQRQEVKNTLISTKFTDSETLAQELNSIFYIDGEFNPKRENLKRIYSDYEINNILTNPDAQRIIKKTLETLKNNSEIVVEESYYPREFLVKNTNVNSLGFMQANNPLDVEQQSIQQLGGISQEDEFNNRLETLSEQTNLDPQVISYDEMQEYKRMKSYRVVGDLLVRVNENDTKVTLEQTLAFPKNMEISDDIIYLNSLPQDIYDENIQDVKDLILEIEKKAAKQGINIVGLNDKVNNSNRDEIYDILEDVNDLTISPSQASIDSFTQKYNQVFNVTPNLKEVVEKVKPSRLKNALLNLETEESEYDLFNKFSLIKVSKNTYQKVKKNPNLEEMYDKLYQIAQYNQGILPIEAFPLANEGGVLNLSTLRNPNNKEILVNDIQTFLENSVTKLDVPNKGVENNELQQLLTFKYYFNTPVTFKESVVLQKENNNFNMFTGNESYLTSDYVSDFYSEYLQEKIKDSDVFQNFYSKFSINERGIRLEKTDAITVGILEDYLNSNKIKQVEDFRNYSLLSKQMPTFKTSEIVDTDFTREFKRSLYASNPNTLDLTRDNYTKLSDTSVSIKGATEGFIRLRDGVYEMITTDDENGFYEKVNIPTTEYKTYSVEEPILSVDVTQYGAQEATENKEFTTVEKNYSKNEEEKINSDNFECL
jgi:hypothetical protein